MTIHSHPDFQVSVFQKKRCGEKLHHIEKLNSGAGFCDFEKSFISVPHWDSDGIQHSAGTNEPAGKQMIFIQGMLILLPAAAFLQWVELNSL